MLKIFDMSDSKENEYWIYKNKSKLSLNTLLNTFCIYSTYIIFRNLEMKKKRPLVWFQSHTRE